MIDDTGDIDRNGIPDALQLDEVVVPPEPASFGVLAPDPGLPGITAPIEATADALARPVPEPPAAPTEPPDDADEAAMTQYQRQLLEYQQAMQQYQLLMETMSNVMKSQGDALGAIARNLRG